MDPKSMIDPEQFYSEDGLREFLVLYAYVRESICQCMKDDLFLIVNDSSEQSICHRIALYLEVKLHENKEYSDYVADVEYNRGYAGYNRRTKKVNGNPARLDIAVHKRAPDPKRGYDNLIAIEAKKTSYAEKHPDCLKSDKERLFALTDWGKGFAYRAGFLIMISDSDIRIAEAYSCECRDVKVKMHYGA